MRFLRAICLSITIVWNAYAYALPNSADCLEVYIAGVPIANISDLSEGRKLEIKLQLFKHLQNSHPAMVHIPCDALKKKIAVHVMPERIWQTSEVRSGTRYYSTSLSLRLAIAFNYEGKSEYYLAPGVQLAKPGIKTTWLDRVRSISMPEGRPRPWGEGQSRYGVAEAFARFYSTKTDFIGNIHYSRTDKYSTSREWLLEWAQESFLEGSSFQLGEQVRTFVFDAGRAVDLERLDIAALIEGPWSNASTDIAAAVAIAELERTGPASQLEDEPFQKRIDVLVERFRAEKTASEEEKRRLLAEIRKVQQELTGLRREALAVEQARAEEAARLETLRGESAQAGQELAALREKVRLMRELFGLPQPTEEPVSRSVALDTDDFAARLGKSVDVAAGIPESIQSLVQQAMEDRILLEAQLSGYLDGRTAGDEIETLFRRSLWEDFDVRIEVKLLSYSQGWRKPLTLLVELAAVGRDPRTGRKTRLTQNVAFVRTDKSVPIPAPEGLLLFMNLFEDRLRTEARVSSLWSLALAEVSRMEPAAREAFFAMLRALESNGALDDAGAEMGRKACAQVISGGSILPR